MDRFVDWGQMRDSLLPHQRRLRRQNQGRLGSSWDETVAAHNQMNLTLSQVQGGIHDLWLNPQRLPQTSHQALIRDLNISDQKDVAFIRDKTFATLLCGRWNEFVYVSFPLIQKACGQAHLKKLKAPEQIQAVWSRAHRSQLELVPDLIHVVRVKPEAAHRPLVVRHSDHKHGGEGPDFPF
jgi:hypothetical protein